MMGDGLSDIVKTTIKKEYKNDSSRILKSLNDDYQTYEENHSHSEE